MKKTIFVLLAVACLIFAVTSIGYAYQEGASAPWAANATGVTSTCNGCHGLPATAPAYTGGTATGPHGGFTNSTDKCDSCHTVHEALSTNQLLFAMTEFGVCNTCHDAAFQVTGSGYGVYGAIRAAGGVVQARHDIDGYNNADAGGNPPGTKSYVATPGALSLNGGFWNPNHKSSNGSGTTTLTCGDCHTPHGYSVVAAFQGERVRTANRAGTPGDPFNSTELLRNNLNGAPTPTYSVYSSDWCSACHQNRHSNGKAINGLDLKNHPVDQGNTAYWNTTAADGGVAWNTWGKFASSPSLTTSHQAGWSREATSGSTWKPMCQQCHNDYRNVEAAESISLILPDGVSGSTDNPRFQTFPHETLAAKMLVQSGDDLCLNCHPTGSLP